MSDYETRDFWELPDPTIDFIYEEFPDGTIFQIFP